MSTKYASFIKTTRIKKGVSQSEVAKKLGISRTSYIAVEQGKRELTVSELGKLLNILGVSREEFEGLKQIIKILSQGR